MIRTERLVLRQWEERDREPWAAMGVDPEVMQHFPRMLDRVSADNMFDRMRSRIDENGWGLWAVERDGEFLGFTGLVLQQFEAHFTPATEVGWRFARHAWGNGYATEAGRAAIEYGFSKLELPEIVSMTAVGNVRSRAVMERLGMSRNPDDDFEHPHVPEGSPVRSHVLYRIARPAL